MFMGSRYSGRTTINGHRPSSNRGRCQSRGGGPMPAQGQDFIYPKDFRAKKIATNGTRLHVRIGGTGPAVVLIHGYGETGDMWVPLAKELAQDHTVVVPDLRGMGLSAI